MTSRPTGVWRSSSSPIRPARCDEEAWSVQRPRAPRRRPVRLSGAAVRRRGGGAGQLVLDDDRPAVFGFGLDVEVEAADRHLGGHNGEDETELVCDDVEVLGQPWG